MEINLLKHPRKTMNKKAAIESMGKALQTYKADKKSAKEFYAVMQELNEWMKRKAKS